MGKYVFLTLITLTVIVGLVRGFANAQPTTTAPNVPETRIKIAVIDTGLNLNLRPDLKPYVCKTGSLSMIDDDPITDENNHGTNVAGLIAKNIDVSKYCLIIIKFYSPYLSPDEFFRAVRKGVEYAILQKVQYINMSLAGGGTSLSEYRTIQKALNLGIKIAVAAGNGESTKKGFIGVNLDVNCNTYPACYVFENSDNFHVVGSLNSKFSNYGKIVKYWENGNWVGIPVLSGTSQATAIHLSNWVKADSK